MTREKAHTFLLQLLPDKRLNFSEHEAIRVAIDELSQEIVTGHWEHVIVPLPLSDSSKECYQCSICRTHWENTFKYCPYCGAKMKEEEDECTTKSEDV